MKQLFSQFGEVTACWIPPMDTRSRERPYVKFNTSKAAQSALDAAMAGQLYLDGVCLRAEWRLAPAKTQDTRDFEARGSNLMTSRDLMRAAMKAKGGGSRALMADDRDRRKSGKDDKDRDRDRKKDKDRSSRALMDDDRDRKRRSRSRKRSKSRSRKASRRSPSDKSRRARQRSGSRRKSPEAPAALEDAPKKDT